MEPQAHGGALRRSGFKNPNAGRRPALIRKKALRALATRMPILEHIADGNAVQWQEDGSQKLVSVKDSDRLTALALLAKLGMGEQVPVADVKARMRAQLAVIRSQATWSSDELMARLAEVWR